MLDLKYGEIFYNKMVTKEASTSQYSVAILKNCDYKKTSLAILKSEIEHSTGNTWSHSIQLGLSFNTNFKVNHSTDYGGTVMMESQ